MLYYIVYQGHGPEWYYGSHYDDEWEWMLTELIQYDMKNGRKRVIAERAISYNMIEDKLFYSTRGADPDGGDFFRNTALYSVDLKTYKTNPILKVPARRINICNDKLFFTRADQAYEKVYICNFDGSDFQEIEYVINKSW